MTRIAFLLLCGLMVAGCSAGGAACYTEACGLDKIADEISYVFWLIFWFGLLGVFRASINLHKD